MKVLKLVIVLPLIGLAHDRSRIAWYGGQAKTTSNVTIEQAIKKETEKGGNITMDSLWMM